MSIDKLLSLMDVVNTAIDNKFDYNTLKVDEETIKIFEPFEELIIQDIIEAYSERLLNIVEYILTRYDFVTRIRVTNPILYFCLNSNKFRYVFYYRVDDEPADTAYLCPMFKKDEKFPLNDNTICNLLSYNKPFNIYYNIYGDKVKLDNRLYYDIDLNTH